MAADIVKIKCPQCGATLKLGRIPDLERKKVMCPKCSFMGMVAEYQRIEEKPAVENKPVEKPDTPAQPAPKPGPTPGAHPGTIIHHDTIPSVGKLRDAYGMEYPLSFGLNTIGRNALSSSAKIRIPDPGCRMSRVHLIIEVTMPMQIDKNPKTQTVALLQAPQVSHVVRLAKQQLNKTYLNDMLMVYGFEYNLKPGDRINLPDGVSLTFVLE